MCAQKDETPGKMSDRKPLGTSKKTHVGAGRHDGEDLSSNSEGSWNAYIDNWSDLYKEAEHELPKMQKDRRRSIAAVKLRMLVKKLDDDLNHTVLQLGEEEMERFIAMDGDDAATGYLATARRLGKKVPDQNDDGDKLKNATDRVRHMRRSKEMVGMFNKIVKSHDKQLHGAVTHLTKQQMDRIMRENHDKFSGTHRQKGQRKGDTPSAERVRPKGINHDFVTPRVKSAAKSRQAVSLLNRIVDAKDILLKDAIVSMDHKERNLLISKNNDFIKFEALRKRQREEFQLSKGKMTFADHQFATQRVKQAQRASSALEKFEDIVRKKSKALATTVKRIPKPERDEFVKHMNQAVDEGPKRKSQALTVPKTNKGVKSLDPSRYIRGEVMVLRRRVQEDVKSAIRAKDNELEELVADMNDEELDRTLVDCIPSGMDDVTIWKQDRRKESWRRLSAFGVVRDNPSLYDQWKQERHQRRVAHVVGDGQGAKLRTTPEIDGSRRPPWSTDLHYAHQCGARQPTLSTSAKDRVHTGEDSLRQNKPCTKAAERSIDVRSKFTRTAPYPRKSTRVGARTRPASAPLGTTRGVAEWSADDLETTRTPGLARLARVFYQSTLASTASMPGVRSRSLHDCTGCDRPSDSVELVDEEYPAQLPLGNDNSELTDTPGVNEKDVGASQIRVEGEGKADEGVVEESVRGSQDEVDARGVEKRMEDVRLLWAVSQLSAEAVTKKIMYGYSERERAREPNRTRWRTPSKRPQPPSKHRSSGSGRSKVVANGSSAGRRVVARASDQVFECEARPPR